MEKMKSIYLKGDVKRREFMNEISWAKLPDKTLSQLNMFGIKDAKTYEESDYRISLEPALSNYATKLAIGVFIIMMYIGVLAGCFGHIYDMNNTGMRVIFGLAYFFSLFTMVRVYTTYYEENWKEYVLEIHKYPRWMIERVEDDKE